MGECSRSPSEHTIRQRFVLGTVQIGLPYGRMRHSALMPRSHAFAILDRAWALGVRAFDTAEAYGESADRLRQWLLQSGHVSEVQVITKVKPYGEQDLAVRAESALCRFEGVAALTLLSHGEVNGDAWAAIADVAHRTGARPGQSVYEAAEVRRTCALSGIARVQVPGNVFDREPFDARGTTQVPLDVRSVYLQGILLASPECAELTIRGAGPLARAVQRAASEAGSTTSVMLVAAMLRTLDSHDRLVIGADTPDQLDVLAEAVDVDPDRIHVFQQSLWQEIQAPIDRRILDPRRW